MREIVTLQRNGNHNTILAGRDNLTVHDGVVYVHDGETPGGVPITSGSDNSGGGAAASDVFIDAVDDMIGLDNITAYWTFEEADTSNDGTEEVTINDLGPNELNWTLPANISSRLGNPLSAVADGRTGLLLHSNIDLPFHPSMWPSGYKDNWSCVFAVNFTGRYDYTNISIKDENGVEYMRIALLANSRIRVRMLSSNLTDYWVNLIMEAKGDFLPDDFPYAGKMLVGVINDSTYFYLRVNQNFIRIDKGVSTFDSMAALPNDYSQCRIEIDGGIDSPVLSHLFFAAESIDEGEWSELLNAAGFDSVGTVPAPTRMGIAPYGLRENFFNSTPNDVRNLWTFDAVAGQGVEDYMMGNHLRAYGNTYIEWNYLPIIDDGRRAMYFSGTLLSDYGSVGVWSTDSFTYGIVVDTGRNSTFSPIVFDLRGYDNSNTMFIKAEITIDATNIRGALINEAGDEYAHVLFDQKWIAGPGRYFVILTYNDDTDTMDLWVNGYKQTVDTASGTGTKRLSIPDLNTNAPTFHLAGEGTVHTAFYCERAMESNYTMAIFSAAGFENVRPQGYTGTISLGVDKSIEVINGIITNYTEIE